MKFSVGIGLIMMTAERLIMMVYAFIMPLIFLFYRIGRVVVRPGMQMQVFAVIRAAQIKQLAKNLFIARLMAVPGLKVYAVTELVLIRQIVRVRA